MYEVSAACFALHQTPAVTSQPLVRESLSSNPIDGSHPLGFGCPGHRFLGPKDKGESSGQFATGSQCSEYRDRKNRNNLWQPEFILPSGDRYTGYWRVVNGRCVDRDGKGTCIYAKGGTYEGDWKQNKRHGNGVQRWRSGDVYDGEWKNDKMEGKRKWIYINGSMYVGDFKADKFSGFGELKYSDGGKYSGQWLQGMKEGQATMSWANGGSYVGAYVKDKRCGYGVMRYATGGVYAGDWAADTKHGHGVFTNTDGTTVVGMWNNDKPVVGGGGFQGQGWVGSDPHAKNPNFGLPQFGAGN